jgi:4-amino-4-deoxy-L-arabinose transferase-like glycosyltransferase
LASKFSLISKLCVLALLITLCAILCGRISHPWTFNDDYNGAFWSQAARNLQSNGYFTTAGVPAPLYFGQPPIPADQLYVHHPTFLAAMALVDHRTLGDSEWAARCLPILFSIATAILLALLVAKCLNWPTAAFTLAFFVAQPMELHYGQMVNFEPPELFFLLTACCTFYLWRARGEPRYLAISLAATMLALWTDWLGYLLVILLACHALTMRRGRNAAFALISTAVIAGLGFLVQIKLAQPSAWIELTHAFHERSSHSDLAGGNFTLAQWLRTEATYLTSLYHSAAIVIALCGAVAAWISRKRLSPLQKVPLKVATIFFILDTLYVCGLRNQSYIHDFASFYFLIPISIFSGFFAVRFIAWMRNMKPTFAKAATAICIVVTLILLVTGFRSLANIDTQFCILDDDNSEPANLMPDLGQAIVNTFAPGVVVLCNFDQYYSPLPFYARHEITRAIATPADWNSAIADAAPHPAGGIIWTGAQGAADLVKNLPLTETHAITVDGIPFTLWIPPGSANNGLKP